MKVSGHSNTGSPGGLWWRANQLRNVSAAKAGVRRGPATPAASLAARPSPGRSSAELTAPGAREASRARSGISPSAYACRGRIRRR
ncbi:MAG TPA: hypothetical protein VH912_15485 [Streptosporangiaceae bacterium]